jgi:acyl-CoA dehydrogenase
MEIALSELQMEIDASVRKVCAQFDDSYWHECDETARFPEEFYAAMAAAAWLSITMPQELGGAGLGVTEAAIMMHAVSSSGGAQAAASGLHINLFGPHAIVVHGRRSRRNDG